MNCPSSYVFHDYVDETLPPIARRGFELHLAQCEACRTQVALIQALRTKTANLPRAVPPARDLWPGIEKALESPLAKPRAILLPGRWWLALAAAVIVVALGLIWHQWTGNPAPAWAVASLAGAPQVDQRLVSTSVAIRAGQWLETDAASRARLHLDSIGEVRVEPNSRVRVLDATTTQHRIELARGTLHAFIWAPPRLFFVETPSATAIDLGCAYELTVDDTGAGVLHVTSGFVALEFGAREAIVPAGMICLTRRGAGPGTPFNADASAPLKRALERFDFEAGSADAIDEVLRSVRAADTVTLWHLLARVPGSRRTAVFDALATYYPPPLGVTREGIVSGDRSMANLWAAELGLHVLTRQ